MYVCTCSFYSQMSVMALMWFYLIPVLYGCLLNFIGGGNATSDRRHRHYVINFTVVVFIPIYMSANV